MPEKVLKDPQLYVSKEARKVYDKVKSLDEFASFDNKDMFIMAVLFGYRYDCPKELKRTERADSGFTRERYLTDKDNAILKAIAIEKTDSLDVIKDIPRVYAIAEEYANGGISHLKEFVFDDPASLIKKLNNYLFDHLE